MAPGGEEKDPEALAPEGSEEDAVVPAPGSEEKDPAALVPEGSEEDAAALAPGGEKNNPAALVPEGEEENAAALAPGGEKNNPAALVPEGEEEDTDDNAEWLVIWDPRAKPAVHADAATVAARWRTDRGRWFILACIPRVARREVGFMPGVVDVRVSKLAAPPRATKITVHHHLAPQSKSVDSYPYFVAGVNHGGRLLLCASQGADPDALSVDSFVTEALGGAAHHGDKAYILCDTFNCKASRFPNPGPDLRRTILNPFNAFFLGDGVIVELQPPTTSSNDAALLCYNASHPRDNGWSAVNTNYPLLRRPWGSHGTFFHDEKVWWTDLSYGLLYADRLAMLRGELSFVPLPPGSELQPGTPDLDRRRCVGVSAGALRFVKIHMLRGREGKTVPAVSVWTLVDDATIWRRDCTTPFQWIWDDHGYRNMKLRPEVPAVALVHPNHSGVVYFLQQSRLFGVDVLAGRVVEWQYGAMLHPPVPYHSSRFVRPWELPHGHMFFQDEFKKDVPSLSEADKWSYRDVRRKLC